MCYFGLYELERFLYTGQEWLKPYLLIISGVLASGVSEMDLYSSLFNFFEESKQMDIELDMERRDFLKAGVAGATSMAGVYKLLEDPQVSEEKLDEMYAGGFPGFDQDRPNMLVDVLEVGDNYLQEEVIDIVESVYDDNGINAIIGRREQDYPEEEFQQSYGGDAAKILGADGYSGFIRDQVSSPMINSAVQTVVSPGKADNPEGWLHYEEKYRTGFATDSIALGSDKAFEQGYPDDVVKGKAIVLMHELGHAQGLEHTDDSSNVMYENVDLNADLEYSEDQWDKIKRSI